MSTAADFQSSTPTIIVTGGTGFVGRRLMPRLVDAYGADNILCLAYDQADNELEQSGRALLDRLGVRYIPVDIVSGRGLDKAPKSPRMVFHLASNTDTGANDHTVNDVGTRNLIAAIEPLDPSCHFLFTSSIAVSDHRADPDRPVDEGTHLKAPYHDYGRRKLAVEHFLTDRARKDGFKLTMIRLCAVFGAGPKGDGLYDSIRRLVAKNSPVVRLNYPGMLSVVNVDDIAEIFVMVSRAERNSGEADLYIPVGEALTISQLIRHYYDAMHIAYHPIRLPRFFWRLCDTTAKFFFALEPILPHSFNNRVWQFSLLVGTGFYNSSTKIQRRFPELHLKRFGDTVQDMI